MTMSSSEVPSFILLLASILINSVVLNWAQMSCGPRMSPRLLMEIPCDMTKSSFCTLPGSAYPWSSVRRYIYENQGFMRRMYGDQRQSLVLKNEIEDMREKYDSIYYYGRGRGLHKENPSDFGPGSDINEEYQSTSNSMPTSSSPPDDNDSNDNDSNRETSNFSKPFNDSEIIESSEREQITSEESTVEKQQIDINPSTTTQNTLHEDNNIPNPSPYADLHLSSTASQTTSTASTEQTQAEPQKGVNACPVKEEVIAPYWANNTRGETLALLNVYPFEQYVHWEKCAYENSQMFCRDGCRCEQQYRLHRLLAFDPKNECRGIFADWFRFPACCVCICYDLPKNSYLRFNRRRARL